MPFFQRGSNMEPSINTKTKTLLLELAVHLKIDPVTEIATLLKYLEYAHVGEQQRDLLIETGSFLKEVRKYD